MSRLVQALLNRVLTLVALVFKGVMTPWRELSSLCFGAFYLLLYFLFAIGHLLMMLNHITRICLSFSLWLSLRLARRMYVFLQSLWSRLTLAAPEALSLTSSPQRRIGLLRAKLKEASSVKEWEKIALLLDRLEGNVEWKQTDVTSLYDFVSLQKTVNLLSQAREREDVESLVFCLQSVFSRSFCHLNSSDLYSHSHIGTKALVEDFYARVVEQISYLCSEQGYSKWSLTDKLRFFQRARKSYGRTALCLSGGGALALYHIGVCKALLEGKCLPNVIAGTSGGAIVCGVLATRTDAELLDPGFLSEGIGTRFGRFLPPLRQQIVSFLTRGVCLDADMFTATARNLCGELTFEEAFRRTGREVSITVAHASFAHEALVLNHITSPHVFIWSAVVASCALPMLMPPQTLMAKRDGRVVPFFSSGSHIDGSIVADVPFKRLSELFNAQFVIVSQTNPHVAIALPGDTSLSSSLPFHRSISSNKERMQQAFLEQETGHRDLLARIEHDLLLNIGFRLQRLVKLKVLPRIYGTDFSGVLDQFYVGNVTIQPLKNAPDSVVLQTLMNPTNEAMNEYVSRGQRETFGKLSQCQHAMLYERTLDDVITLLRRQLQREREAAIRQRPSSAGEDRPVAAVREDERAEGAAVEHERPVGSVVASDTAEEGNVAFVDVEGNVELPAAKRKQIASDVEGTTLVAPPLGHRVARGVSSLSSFGSYSSHFEFDLDNSSSLYSPSPSLSDRRDRASSLRSSRISSRNASSNDLASQVEGRASGSLFEALLEKSSRASSDV